MIMSNPVRERYQSAVPLPIPEKARRIAQQFSQTQPTAQKAEQVRLNTLAVWVACYYCELMGIPTDLEQSDSWNPVMQVVANVADLILPDVGVLECRPIEAEADRCLVPPEVWDLRIGYVAIEIDDDCQTAQLLGFTPTVTGEELSVAELQPPEDLLNHLYVLKQLNQHPAPVTLSDRQRRRSQATVNLSQWLNQRFDDSWQSVFACLSSQQMTSAFNFRSAEILETSEPQSKQVVVRRAKLIDLAVKLGAQQVVLLAEVQAATPDKLHIGVQVHPNQAHPYLPPGLELAVLESSNAVFLEAQSRQADNYIQLKFSGQSGESFKVRITMDSAVYVEEFIIV